MVIVRTEAFEGPFDLLLKLIDKNEVDIYDIPIFTITEQYLEYIGSFAESADMEAMSGFILMAATLLEIKSKLLLPPPKIDYYEEEEDPRAELVRRLEEYRRFKEIVPDFRAREEEACKFYYKTKDASLPIAEMSRPVPDVGKALFGISAERLYTLFIEILNRREMKVDRVRADFGAIAKDTYTIAQQTAHLAELLAAYGRIGFYEAFDGAAEKIEIIVTFLALLELIKTRRAVVVQEEAFGEIFIIAA